jgi:hypothetical protein
MSSRAIRTGHTRRRYLTGLAFDAEEFHTKHPSFKQKVRRPVTPLHLRMLRFDAWKGVTQRSWLWPKGLGIAYRVATNKLRFLRALRR